MSRRLPRSGWAAIGAALVAVAVIASFLLGSNDRSVPGQTGSPPLPAASPAGKLFAPDSVWNAPLPADAPLDSASAALIERFGEQIAAERQAGIGPWIQTDESSTTLYAVPAEQPTVPVQVDDRPEPSYVALQQAFSAVPIPPEAQPAAGSDGHMTIYQPSTDRLWEFWRAHREADGWHASWGGAIDDVSEDPGYYTADAYPGSTSQWGSTATSLPVVAGTILVSELARRQIDHVLAMNIPDARAGVFAWPAQRTDGTGDLGLLPEGAKLRLDPTLELDSLGLPPATLAIAEAAQTYGIIIRDRTHHATAFFAEDPAPLGRNPYPTFFGGEIPSELLADFPWDRLQVLQMHLCTSAPCPPPS